VLGLKGIRSGRSRDAIWWLRIRRKCGACVVQGREPTRQLVECHKLNSVGTQSGSGWWCAFGRTAGRATRPGWI